MLMDIWRGNLVRQWIGILSGLHRRAVSARENVTYVEQDLKQSRKGGLLPS